MKLLIGRTKEKALLQKALVSDEAEMISVIGRRRVGKTYLINSVYSDQIIFEITGSQNAPKKEQLENFAEKLGISDKIPSSWNKAFHLLRKYLEAKKGLDKMVVFFDEVPWLASPKSGFLRSLGYFWNDWASKQNIVLVICGSAASWMIKNVVREKGGLYNRLTRRIILRPFNLLETEAFLKAKNINLDYYQIIQLYMAMGGIPHYLKEVEAGLSVAQNIDQICFSETGLLRDEFSQLYAALFKNSENHIAAIRALATRWQGLTRKEIIDISKLPNGGNFTNLLEELITSGFVTAYFPFNKRKKEKLYRLTDEYSLFYLHFMENKANAGLGIWQLLSQTQAYKSWSGYAFESLCLKHILQIKKGLGISGVYTYTSAFSFKGNDYLPGIQIDLLIDRNDHVINICEMKFYNSSFSISKAAAVQWRNKMGIFKEISKTQKQIFITLITTFGLNHNQHSLGLIDKVLTMAVLFDDVGA